LVTEITESTEDTEKSPLKSFSVVSVTLFF